LAVAGLAAVLFWPTGSSQKVKNIYEQAQAMYESANYEEAINKYNEALLESEKRFVSTDVIDKDFPTLAKYKIAVCYSNWAEQSGDVAYYDKAQEYIEEIFSVAKVRKHQEGITYLWGHVLFKKEQYEESEPKFVELIETFPDSLFVENAWYARGNLNFKLEKFEESRIAFKSVIDEFPHSEYKDDAQQFISQSFLIEENYEQALAAFDVMTTDEFKNYPQLQPEAKYKAAHCLFRLGRDDEAIARYNGYIAEHPGDKYVTAAYFDLGAIYSKQKDYDNARQNYELALQNTPDKELQAEIQREIARVYFDQEDYGNAVTAYEKLIDNYPDCQHIAEAKLGIGDSYFKLEQMQDAITGYQMVVNEHSDDPVFVPYATFQIGEAYYKVEDFESSLSWYSQVLDKYPDEQVAPHALYGAIWSLSELGRDEEVQALANKFIEEKRQDPDFDAQAAEIQMRLGDLQLKMEKYENAATEYKKVWDEYRQDLPKFFQLKITSKFQEGYSYYKASQPPGYEEGDADAVFNEELLGKAVEAYKMAIEKFRDKNFDLDKYDDFPNRVEFVENSRLNLALAHEKLQEWDNARNVYKVITKGSDNYERVQLLIAQTYSLAKDEGGAINAYDAVLNNPDISKDNKSIARIKKVDLLRDQKRYAEAAPEYEIIVADDPEGEYADDAQYLVGVCYLEIEDKKQEDLEKAVAAFQKVIDDHSDSPNVPEAYYAMMLAHRNMAENDDANWTKIVEVADIALDKFVDSTDVKVQETLNNINLVRLKALEETRGEGGDIGALIAGLRKVTDNPVSKEDAKARAQLKIGHLLFEVKQYKEAIEEYQKLIEGYPEDDQVMMAKYQVAASYFQMGQAEPDEDAKEAYYSEAAKAAKSALEHNPEPDWSVSIHYALGLAQAGMGADDEAITAFRKVLEFEGQVEDEQKKQSIYDSHTRLAELYSKSGAHTAAVTEYQYIVNHSDEKKTQSRAYFAMALAQDDQLQDYENAVLNYQNAANLAEDVLTKAQSRYREGLIYYDEKKMEDQEKALLAFDTLINEFGGEQDDNTQAMISDARARRADLYDKLGRLDDALAGAESARTEAMASPKATLTQKIQAQYQVGLLTFKKARSFYNEDEGAYNKEYKETSRKAVDAYIQALTIATQGQPIEQVPQDALVYVRYSLYQASQIAYAIHFQPDLKRMTPILETFIQYVDKGLFGDPKKDGELSEHLKTALNFLATGNFDLARMAYGEWEELANKDEPSAAELDAKVKEIDKYYGKAANVFKQLVKRFPNEADTPVWQYQAGESFIAVADVYLRNGVNAAAAKAYRDALMEYEKVPQLNPNHEMAPDALFAISTCYQKLSENETTPPAQKKEFDSKVYELNAKLANDYPNSQYAADAFINVGNNYYNQANAPNLSEEKKEEAYKFAVENYRKALKVPSITPQSKATAEEYLRDTEITLAEGIRLRARNMFAYARDNLKDEAKVKGIRETIAVLEDLVKNYPNTYSADIAYDQIGDAYTELEEWNNAMKAYETLINKYARKKAVLTDVMDAVEYAKRQYTKVFNYTLSLEVHESTTGK